MQPQQPLPPHMQNPNAVEPDYGFIVNPAQAPKKKLALFGGGSLLPKVLLIGAALLLIMIVGLTIKSVTNKPSSASYFIVVAQDQQAIIHVAAATVAQQNVSTTTLNSAVTINATMTSALNNLSGYMKQSGITITPAQLNAKVSKVTDAQLSDAASAGTYESTYATIMNSMLQTYSKDLTTAYNHTTGPKGRTLLSTQYKDAQLLIAQPKN